MSQKRCNSHHDKPVINKKLIKLNTIKSQILWSMLPAVSSANRNNTGERLQITSRIKKIPIGSAHLKGLNLSKGVPANSGELENLIVFIIISFVIVIR